MPGQGGASRETLPPLAGEDHVCPDCGLSYRELTVEQAVDAVHALPAAYSRALAAIPEGARRQRPRTGVWSVVEYLCHVRDVYVTFTIRLHRARTEDRPALEPMFNDLRARRFRYNDADVDAVLGQLAAATAGFCDEVSRSVPADWERTVTRLPSESRTARWLVRQATHEGLHHLRDIRRTGAAATTTA